MISQFRTCASLLVVLLLVGSLLAACKPQDGAEPAVETPAQPTASTGEAPASEGEQGEEQARVPNLQIATLDGGQYDLAEHRGQWVVVNFWATWCGPCLEEMPELSALDAMRGHIEVIGLAYEEINPRVMREFLDKHPVVYPIAIVDVYAPPADFDTPRGLPMTYLIAPDGAVAEKFLGPVTAKKIEAAIAAADGPQPGQTPAPPQP